MSVANRTILVGSVGCTGYDHYFPGLSCDRESAPLSSTTWAGPSEADVLARVEAFAPDHVTWDEYTVSVAESSISLTPVRTAEEPLVAEGCGLDRHLHLGFTIEVDIDEGSVTGVVPAAFLAPEDGSAVYVELLGPVALSPEWEAIALASYAERHPTSPFEQWRMSSPSVEEWATGAQLDVEADGFHAVSVMWRGHLSNVP